MFRHQQAAGPVVVEVDDDEPRMSRCGSGTKVPPGVMSNIGETFGKGLLPASGVIPPIV